MALQYIIIFVFGLIAGSFVNCAVYRLETNKSFFKGRSFCPNCKHTLGFWDLIPVLSFVFLKGRCRYCKKKISIHYPIVEMLVGLAFPLILLSPEMPDSFIGLYFLLIVSSFLLVIFVFDLKHYIIPDRVVFPAILIVFLYRIFTFNLFLNCLVSAVAASAFFLAIYLISQGKWIGFGDVKLAFLMGLLLGFPKILVALFFAFMIGAIIGIGLISFKKKTMKSEVPFGPFLIVGTFIALLWGSQIANWYIGLIM